MANEWLEISDGFDDWQVEMKQHLYKFRVVRTHDTQWAHTSCVICSEHKECPVKFTVYDSAVTGKKTLSKLAGVAHREGQGFGLSHDILEIVEPLIGAGLPPKIIRNILSEKHGITEERLPSNKKLSNFLNY